MDNTQKAQEEEYQFPYHYLPVVDHQGFRWFPYWSWGFKYLTGIEVVMNEVADIDFNSLIDVGCGDGRFIREVRSRYNDKQLVGVDYSDRAIRLAKALNPRLDYRAKDITVDSFDTKFDIVTMIEVLEHIVPDDVAKFVRHLAQLMHKESVLIMTVPHRNQDLIEKHYQHFDSTMLKDIFTDQFEIDHLFFFDSKSRLVSSIQRLVFNKYWIIRHQALLNFLYRRYRQSYLYCDERSCQRIGVVTRLKRTD